MNDIGNNNIFDGRNQSVPPCRRTLSSSANPAGIGLMFDASIKDLTLLSVGACTCIVYIYLSIMQ